MSEEMMIPTAGRAGRALRVTNAFLECLVRGSVTAVNADDADAARRAGRAAASAVLPVDSNDPVLRRFHDLVAAALTEAAHVPADPELQRVCVVLLVTDPEGRILMGKNKKRGGWELPGGKKRASETWREAAAREGLEETGLRITLALGAPFDVLDGEPVSGADFSAPIIVVRGRAKGEPVAGSDMEEARWMAVEDIPWADLSPIKSREVIERWCHASGVDVVRLSPSVRLGLSIAHAFLLGALDKLLNGGGKEEIESDVDRADRRVQEVYQRLGGTELGATEDDPLLVELASLRREIGRLQGERDASTKLAADTAEKLVAAGAEVERLTAALGERAARAAAVETCLREWLSAKNLGAEKVAEGRARKLMSPPSDNEAPTQQPKRGAQ